MSLCPQALLLMNSITSDERFSPKIRQKEGGGANWGKEIYKPFCFPLLLGSVII